MQGQFEMWKLFCWVATQPGQACGTSLTADSGVKLYCSIIGETHATF